MATLEELAKVINDLRRRLELAETKLSQQAGQFEFITGQLRDMQLYMHARFGDIDERFDKVNARLDRLDAKMEAKFAQADARFERLEAKVDALPRLIAELIAAKK